MQLKRFFPYYGSKARLASAYPVPTFPEIVEPFGGSAGYSLRYADHKVTLVELDPVLYGVWSYLTRVKSREILRLPTDVNHVDDLGPKVPQEAKWLVGFWFKVSAQPSKKRVGWGKRPTGRTFSSWDVDARQRIAEQVEQIRHWRIVQGSAFDQPNRPATWFVDPPYQNDCGRAYSCNKVDFAALGRWCRARHGQVIVCEQEGADWLPFRHFKTIQGVSKKPATEIVWVSDEKKAGKRAS